MNEPFDLRKELIAAASFLLDRGQSPCQWPPIIFQYITPNSGRKGHLSTPWAFSLYADVPDFGKIASVREVACLIANRNPNWEAENGYINITLTDGQMNSVVDELAAAFVARGPLFVRPNDSDEHFLMQYFIYLAGQFVPQESYFTGQGTVPLVKCDPRPAIVYTALGGNCDFLARELYRYYKKNYNRGTVPCLAAAEIFVRRLYKTV